MFGEKASVPLCLALLIAATGCAFAQGTSGSFGTSGGTAGSAPGAAPPAASSGGPTVAPPSYNPSAVPPPPVAGTTPGSSGSPPMVSAPAVPGNSAVPGGTQPSTTSSGGRFGCATTSQAGTPTTTTRGTTETVGTSTTGTGTSTSGIDGGTPRIANDPALGNGTTVQTGRASGGASGPIVSGSTVPGSPSNVQAGTRAGC